MADTEPWTDRSRLFWILAGARGVTGLPALVLMSAMIGFGSLARDAGFTLGQALFSAFGIWALPSMIVMVGSIMSGLGVLPTAVAVAFASMRFTPMVMAIVPEMRGKRTTLPTLLFLSHFVAITAWVHGFSNFARVPRDYRAAFFGGFAVTLTCLSTVIVGVSHQVSTTLPPVAAAALVFLTPIYFLTSLWSNARYRYDRTALALGLVIGPAAQAVLPSGGLIVGGIAAGSLAYVISARDRG